MLQAHKFLVAGLAVCFVNCQAAPSTGLAAGAATRVSGEASALWAELVEQRDDQQFVQRLADLRALSLAEMATTLASGTPAGDYPVLGSVISGSQARQALDELYESDDFQQLSASFGTVGEVIDGAGDASLPEIGLADVQQCLEEAVAGFGDAGADSLPHAEGSAGAARRLSLGLALSAWSTAGATSGFALQATGAGTPAVLASSAFKSASTDPALQAIQKRYVAESKAGENACLAVMPATICDGKSIGSLVLWKTLNAAEGAEVSCFKRC